MDTAFRIAVSDAFHKGLREAGIVLLEPIMKLTYRPAPPDVVKSFMLE